MQQRKHPEEHNLAARHTWKTVMKALKKDVKFGNPMSISVSPNRCSPRMEKTTRNRKHRNETAAKDSKLSSRTSASARNPSRYLQR
jgi:hypothetical protein